MGWGFKKGFDVCYEKDFVLNLIYIVWVVVFNFRIKLEKRGSRIF